jgi:hypothetical protein
MLLSKDLLAGCICKLLSYLNLPAESFAERSYGRVTACLQAMLQYNMPTLLQRYCATRCGNCLQNSGRNFVFGFKLAKG